MTNISIRECLSHIKVPNKLVHSDNRITNKFLYSLLKKHRDFLIKRLDGNFGLLKLQYLFQTWDCVKLIPVSAAEACCDIKSKCKIYRTKEELPPTVTSYYGPIIKKIVSVDGYTDLTYITDNEWRRLQSNPDVLKYDKTLYYYILNNYIYFPNLKWKKIQIEAYFEEDISKYNECEEQESDCTPFLDEDFKIPRELLKACIDSVNIELVELNNKIIEDVQQDKNINRKN